jgi:hypothetical protein
MSESPKGEKSSSAATAEIFERLPLERLITEFQRLEQVLCVKAKNPALPSPQEMVSRLRAIADGESKDAETDMEWVVSAVGALRQSLKHDSSSCASKSPESSLQSFQDDFLLKALTLEVAILLRMLNMSEK